MAHNISLETQNLSVCHNLTKALDEVSLPLYENCITALIGPSGSGKSVLLKSFNRLNELEGATTTGRVLLNGEDIYRPGTDLGALRKRVGMVFQSPAVFRMNIYDNVSFGPRMEGVRSRAQLDELVESALRVVGLWKEVKSRLKSGPHGLTTGQLQRLCIARTLATQPEVLLLDEATNNLGAGNAMLVEELLLQLATNGITIVMATHDMQQAVRLSNYCAFMLDGELVEWGDTMQMFSAPAHKRTENYIAGRYLV